VAVYLNTHFRDRAVGKVGEAELRRAVKLADMLLCRCIAYIQNYLSSTAARDRAASSF
jgi:hypothetical protein